jgi:gentisate 1,2-dioxygenase
MTPTTDHAEAAPVSSLEPDQRDYTKDARIYEYGAAANPEIAPIPVLLHPPELHESGPTKIHSFDISDFLEIEYPCTSPNLLASFIRINERESIDTSATATSQAFYVIRGTGYTDSKEHGKMEWSTGDMLVVPITECAMTHHCISAEETGGAALYWIHDQPLMEYLGVHPSSRKFEPTIFKRENMLKHVEEISHKEGHSNNRLGVLLGNAKFDQTKTLTHVLWSLLNSIPGKTVQRPHRHNSVALDLCVSAKPGVYSLMGKEIDKDGFIISPLRCDWVPGGVFITPPGWWHSHHNESDDIAWVLPIQDAGLYTHQRTLDIRFVDEELELHASGRIRGTSFTVNNKQYTMMKSIGNMAPKQARMKRVQSAQCMVSDKRLKCTQLGKEIPEEEEIKDDEETNFI